MYIEYAIPLKFRPTEFVLPGRRVLQDLRERFCDKILIERFTSRVAAPTAKPLPVKNPVPGSLTSDPWSWGTESPSYKDRHFKGCNYSIVLNPNGPKDISRRSKERATGESREDPPQGASLPTVAQRPPQGTLQVPCALLGSRV